MSSSPRVAAISVFFFLCGVAVAGFFLRGGLHASVATSGGTFVGSLLGPDRFTNNGDGSVTDVSTKLQWRRCALGQEGDDCSLKAQQLFKWDETAGACQALDAGGGGDWRVPTFEELRSIVDTSQQNPSIDSSAFPNTPSGVYWSATSVPEDDTAAWYVAFSSGGSGHYGKGHYYLVRCVRSPSENGTQLANPSASGAEPSLQPWVGGLPQQFQVQGNAIPSAQ